MATFSAIYNISAFVRGLYEIFFHTSKENIFNFSITRNKKKVKFYLFP